MTTDDPTPSEDPSHAPPPELPPSATGGETPERWSQRKGRGLFWLLLFAPAVLTLTVLAIIVGTKAEHVEPLFAVAALSYGACLYCGYWLAKGFRLSTPARWASAVALSLAFLVLNGIVFFAGCFGVVMTLA